MNKENVDKLLKSESEFNKLIITMGAEIIKLRKDVDVLKKKIEG